MFEISPLARKYAPWSISKAGAAATCPAQFANKYIHKTLESVKSPGNEVGTAAHSILEFRQQGMSLKQAKEAALEKTPLMEAELEILQSFTDQMEDFLRRFDKFCKENHVEKVMLEEEWGITDTGVKTGFFAPDVYFRGKVDLGALTRDGDLYVVDHKTGIAKDIQKDTKFKHQLNSYAVLAAANIPTLAGVRSGIHFLQGDVDKRSQWLDYIDVHRIKTLYTPWLYKHLNEVADSNLHEPFVARPRPKWPCGWCNYRGTCQPYQEMMRGA